LVVKLRLGLIIYRRLSHYGLIRRSYGAEPPDIRCFYQDYKNNSEIGSSTSALFA